MIKKWGMSPAFGQVALRDYPRQENAPDGPLAEKIMRTAEQIVKEQLERAIESLKENQQYLDKIVDEVLDKNTLYKEDLEKILPPIRD